MPVKIHNKEYLTVAERIATFREEHKDWSIDTDLVSHGELVVIKAVIHDEQGKQIGSGYAEELRGSTNINKTSAVENCETSAIGRALASCGYGGEQYASANEVSDAILQQKEKEIVDRYAEHNKAVFDNYELLSSISEGIQLAITAPDEEYRRTSLSSAAEVWFTMSDALKTLVWVAPTKGGFFSTKEREIMKTNEFKESYYGPGE